MKKNILLIKNLQFYWRLKTSPNEKNIVPNFLPFGLVYEDDLGLFTQKKNEEVLKSLKLIYKEEYNIGNIQEIGDWFHFYKKDFLDFMNFSINSSSKKIKKILEIGCGSCALLYVFKKRGFDVMGIDPSILSKKMGKQRGVKVIVGFYPSKKITGKFDLIFHSDVLEHVYNPVEFLNHNFEQLNIGGVIILTVPDCTDSIAHGDISMLYHQHMNYFDKDSLKITLETVGFSQVHVEKASFGGSLNCYGEKMAKKKVKKVLVSSDQKFSLFLKKNKKVVNKLSNYVKGILKGRNKSLGFYAPVRALPYIALIGLNKNFRFFDDTTRWHLKYLDGIDIPVENFEDLKRNPVTNLIIMSPTFGKLIEKKVLDFFGSRVRTKKLTDFFL